jgi:hypothetical protein
MIADAEETIHDPLSSTIYPLTPGVPMSDFMTARLPEDSTNGLPDGVTIEPYVVIKDSLDPERMSVRFVIGADTPDKAFAFARNPALIDEGMRSVRKEGLASPGVNGHAIPIPCDVHGDPLANPMGAVDPDDKQRYYYSITYHYLGED